MKYKARIADSLLKEKLDTFGAVLIIGPKGCGKQQQQNSNQKALSNFKTKKKETSI